MIKTEITEVHRVDEELIGAMTRLMPQLSPWLTTPPRERLEAIVRSSTSALWVARNTADDRIVGSLTMAWYAAPSAVKGWIEDVVVDSEIRSTGVGRMLVATALERAREVGIDQLLLTSTPARIAARTLYKKVGFKEVGTTLFAIKSNEI